MSELNCGFNNEDRWFRYRAAGIIIEDGCVLFIGSRAENYLYSVGGAVHHGETAEDAARREVFEETGVNYEVDRLAVIHENFFDESDGTLRGMRCHEICFYFLMKPRGTRELGPEGRNSFGFAETRHWIPIAELKEYRAYPEFLADYLARPHEGIEHIVSDERPVKE